MRDGEQGFNKMIATDLTFATDKYCSKCERYELPSKVAPSIATTLAATHKKSLRATRTKLNI